MSTKRHWYHCTSEWKGDRWTAAYRPPIYKSSREPNTPRICVCHNIPNCFSAVLFHRTQPVYVYRTVKKMRGITPRQVWDAPITLERWIIPPVELELHEVVAPRDVQDIQDSIHIYHIETKANCSVRLRIAQLIRAWEVLGDRFPNKDEMEVVEKLRTHFGYGDSIDDWILDQVQVEKTRQKGKLCPH